MHCELVVRPCCSYNQALAAVKVAQKRFEKLGVPHVRPDDYFAEMVKSDKHMEKVKRRMVQQQQDILAQEDRRKQKANKKFGKQVSLTSVRAVHLPGWFILSWLAVGLIPAMDSAACL